MWSVCDEKAIEAERQLSAQWSNTLQTLLVSAALYSAVVTPFIIESVKQSSGDPAETTRDILLVISLQLSNSCTPPFEHSPTEKSPILSISSGSLLLSVLCSLLVAATALVLLIWETVVDYQIEQYLAQDHTVKRVLYGLRHRAQLARLTKFLPPLLLASVALLLTGLTNWALYADIYLGWMVLGVFVIYLIMILFGLRTAYHDIWNTTASSFERWTRELFQRIRSWLVVEPKWLPKQRTNERWGRERSLEEGSLVYKRMESLLWLVSSIDLTPNSRNALLGVLREIMELPAYICMQLPSKYMNVPWEPIFMFLCGLYLGKSSIMEYTEKELKCAAFLCRALSITTYGSKVQKLKKFIRSLQLESNEVISVGAYHADYNQAWHSSDTEKMQMLRTGFIHACRARKSLPVNYFDFFLLKIREAQRLSKYVPQEAEITELALTCSVPPQNFTDNSSLHLISLESLGVICDILVCRMGGLNPNQGTAVSRYVSIMEAQDPEELGIPLVQMFYAIMAQINCSDCSSDISG